MQSPFRKILVGTIFFALTIGVAVTGYLLAGWQLLDAIYMVTITIFGVGYGEVQPLEHPALKVFTMVVIIAGCSSGIYVVGGVVQLFAEGEINRALGARRMTKDILRLSGHIIICGYGRVGQMLARELEGFERAFVVIDSHLDRVREAQQRGYYALLGSASEETTLSEAGVERAKVLATVLPDDAANVFITLTARELNAKLEIIARGESPSTETKLLRSGANRVVLPAAIGATKIAHMIKCPSADDLLQDTAGKSHLNEELRSIGLEMTEVHIGPRSPLIGQAVGTVEVSGQGGFVILAISQSAGQFLRNPAPEVTLGSGDRFTILGHSSDLPQIRRRAAAAPEITYRGARQ